jgi:hypothetical protein
MPENEHNRLLARDSLAESGVRFASEVHAMASDEMLQVRHNT